MLYSTVAEVAEIDENTVVLDVCCGTGEFVGMAKGAYVGVDLHLPYLQFAHKRNGGQLGFACMDGGRLAVGDGAFDKAMIINALHHLDEATIDRLFVELRRVVRGTVLVVDADPDLANPLEGFLLGLDRGDFIRQPEELRKIVSRHYRIEREERFHNTLHTVPQILFRLTAD